MKFKKTAVLISLCQVAAVAAPPVTGSADPHIVAVSQVSDTGAAFSPTGKEAIQLREARIQVTGPHEQPVSRRLFLVFDPKRGAFCWHVAIEGSPTDLSEQTTWFKRYRAAFEKDGIIYVFTAENGPLVILVQQSSGRATSMGNAEEQALRAVATLNDPPGNVNIGQQWHTVLLSRLSPDFVQAPESQTSGPEPKVDDVQWDGEHWILTLAARWREVITLDAEYNVLSMKKVD